MKFGLFGINMGPCSEPDTLAEVAAAAEAAGFDSLWTGEHVVLPDPQRPPSPLPPDYPILDPAVALAYAAAHTRQILLATGIIILPQRNPLVLAKELASVDVVSGGRLVFGIGIGYLRAEFEALGIPFDSKGPRTLEYLDAIESIWCDQQPSCDGRFVSFAGVQARPRPQQQPRPPVVFGGMSQPAFERAVTRAEGWYGFGLDLEQSRSCLSGLAEATRQHERPASLGQLEITVTPIGDIDRDQAMRYRDLGVDRLALLRLATNATELLEFIADVGEKMIEKV